jgi:hypothetical protein
MRRTLFFCFFSVFLNQIALGDFKIVPKGESENSARYIKIIYAGNSKTPFLDFHACEQDKCEKIFSTTEAALEKKFEMYRPDLSRLLKSMPWTGTGISLMLGALSFKPSLYIPLIVSLIGNHPAGSGRLIRITQNSLLVASASVGLSNLWWVWLPLMKEKVQYASDMTNPSTGTGALFTLHQWFVVLESGSQSLKLSRREILLDNQKLQLITDMNFEGLVNVCKTFASMMPVLPNLQVRIEF